jgi:hypothetical protein
MKTVRYHIQLKSHRTSISMDNIVSDLMAIKLNERPGTKEAHAAVRKQLEAFVAHDLGRAGRRLGRYITEQAVLYISDKILSEKYWGYFMEENDAA